MFDSHQANKVNKEPPEEFDIPLSSEFSAGGACKYFKTQDGVVTLYGKASKTTGGLVNTDILGTMPVGFRIKSPTEFPATMHSGYAAASLLFRTNGVLEIRTGSSSAVSQTSLYFFASYVAV